MSAKPSAIIFGEHPFPRPSAIHHPARSHRALIAQAVLIRALAHLPLCWSQSTASLWSRCVSRLFPATASGLCSRSHRSIFVLSTNTACLRLPRMSSMICSSPHHSQCNVFARYIGADFPKVLEKPIVEYRQANLTIPCTSRRRSEYASPQTLTIRVPACSYC